jgi:hypothetical protein
VQIVRVNLTGASGIFLQVGRAMLRNLQAMNPITGTARILTTIVTRRMSVVLPTRSLVATRVRLEGDLSGSVEGLQLRWS